MSISKAAPFRCPNSKNRIHQTFILESHDEDAEMALQTSTGHIPMDFAGLFDKVNTKNRIIKFFRNTFSLYLLK